MARPLRLQYPGMLVHVMSASNDKRATFIDDDDRSFFLDLLGQTVGRFNWILYTYVLMSNHFHLFFQLLEATLSDGMHWFNGKYTQRFNKRHHRVGHLFQGPFRDHEVEKESYFLELLRYIVLNPVRAGIVDRPDDYAWSSHRAIAGEVDAPPWLAIDDVLIAFAPQRDSARPMYRRFVAEGIGMTTSPFTALVGQRYLGSEEWR